MENEDALPDTNIADRKSTLNNQTPDAIAAGFAYSLVPTFGIDTDGVIVYLNDAALTDFNFEKGSTIGSPFFSLFTEESPDRAGEQALLNKQQLKENEWTNLRHGERRW